MSEIIFYLFFPPTKVLEVLNAHGAQVTVLWNRDRGFCMQEACYAGIASMCNHFYSCCSVNIRAQPLTWKAVAVNPDSQVVTDSLASENYICMYNGPQPPRTFGRTP